MINFQKSSLCFSPRGPGNLVGDIYGILGINTTSSHSKYLRLPLAISRNRLNLFSLIKDSIRKMVAKWKDRFISMAGKEVLIKFVAQAIPNYTMSLF